MKTFLMYRARDFDPEAPLHPQADELIQDLALATLLGAMARGDEFLYAVSQRAVLQSLGDPVDIIYRQDVLRDCLDQYAVVREIYDVTLTTLVEARKLWRGMSPSSVLSGAVTSVELYLRTLRRLRAITDEHAHAFASDGFRQFFAMIARELDDAYLDELDGHLKRLRFRGGVLISGQLDEGNKGTGHVLRRPYETKRRWFARLNSPWSRDAFSFQIADRDEAGARALGELRSRGIVLVANALAQSEDHIASFLRVLRTELAFYLACVNLHTRLREKGEPICFPGPVPAGDGNVFAARGLYDVCLSLLQKDRVVSNDIDADGKALVMITGANQGGKSTFLRSVGLAQLMMQCGMFVPAASLRANVGTGVFTHYKREEDATMRSGKLDEELSRMSDIADAVSPGAVVLFNESFAATNEGEGSEIARQVVRALLEAGVKVFFVTHLYDLAHSLSARRMSAALFLRAERRADGQRTFRQVEGEPLPTSHGVDVYRQVFEAEPAEAATATR